MQQKQNKKIVNTGYSSGGASRTKESLRKWNPIQSSPASDIGINLETLRNRSFDQAINTPIGASAIHTSSMNAVGAGLKCFPRIQYKQLGMSAEDAREWNKKTSAEFSIWAESKDCDVCRRNNFYDLQSILYETQLASGDSFALFQRRIPTDNMPYSLRIKALEATRVSNPYNIHATGIVGPYAVIMQAPNGHRIVNGVEIDQDGAVLAYWVSNKVPYDLTDTTMADWARVEAFTVQGMPNILQICHDTRPESYRGVPLLAPVIETLKQLSRYTTAELTSAIIKSFFSIFFVNTQAGSTVEDIMPSAYSEQPDDGAPCVDVSQYGLGPGTIGALPKGVSVQSVDASKSMSTFEPFTKQLVKQLGAALGIPYEVLMKNFESSYSASRAALLQAWQEFVLRRTWFARDLCQPVYEAWLLEAIAIGRIKAPGFFDDVRIRKAWCNANWYGPTMSILDPVKDVTGSGLRVTYALSTHEQEAAEMTGTDFEENIDQLKYENDLIKKAGLNTGNPEVLAGEIVKGGNDDEKKVLDNQK